MRQQWFGLLGYLLALCAPSPAHADALMRAKPNADITVVLYDEPCAQGAVVNLKSRATWHEGGRVFEGCWGAMAAFGLVLFYFEDRTVTALPMPFFERVRSAS